jgi:hypothetical protein
MVRKQSAPRRAVAGERAPKQAPKKPRKRTARETPNRADESFRDMVLQALELAGGARYLEKLANENPTAFLTLVTKVLPLQVKAEHDVGKRLAKALAWKPPT